MFGKLTPRRLSHLSSSCITVALKMFGGFISVRREAHYLYGNGSDKKIVGFYHRQLMSASLCFPCCKVEPRMVGLKVYHSACLIWITIFISEWWQRWKVRNNMRKTASAIWMSFVKWRWYFLNISLPMSKSSSMLSTWRARRPVNHKKKMAA